MSSIDGDRVRRAIDAAERETTGRIGVRIAHGPVRDPFEQARRQFLHAGLHRHAHRNAVVFLVAPKARRFAVYGDEAIHDRVGDEFWASLVRDMTPLFANGDITAGLELGIARVGERFRAHFPKDARA